MKRKALLSSFLVICVLLFDITAFAQTQDYYSEQYEASGAQELKEYLGEETEDFLESIGCGEIAPEGLMGLSVQSVFNAVIGLFRENSKEPLKGALTASGAVMLISVCSSFFPNDEKSKAALNMICGSFLIISVFASALPSVKAAASAMKLCAGFEKVLIPVLAGILTASGNPASAVSVQGVAFAAAQCIEALAENFAVPMSCIAGTLGAVGAIVPTVRLSAVGELIRKTSSTVIGSAAAMFSGLLAIKSVIATSADGLAAKGIKLATGTFIPVVGGALAEAYSTISGSLVLLKNTVGIYAIIAFVAMCLPCVINLALWILALKLASMLSDLLGNGQCSEILRNISYMFSTINTMLVFSAAVLIITSALTVSMKTGV